MKTERTIFEICEMGNDWCSNYFDEKDSAICYANKDWDHLTKSERKNREIVLFERKIVLQKEFDGSAEDLVAALSCGDIEDDEVEGYDCCCGFEDKFCVSKETLYPEEEDEEEENEVGEDEI